VLGAGTCAGFAAGVAKGHQLVNRSSQTTRVLEVGSRDARDEVEYPGLDLRCHNSRYTQPKFTKRDGSSLPE
jgi:uncharacterized cupin superfamily protein